ncbi:MAG: parB [Chloroflexi bacterium]|nr:parB [Chloroflexota bacterium]
MDPVSVVQEPGARELLEVSIGDLLPTKDQPRQRFDPQPLAELAASIAIHGVLQPLLVTRLPGTGRPPRYRIIAGERRWRAATMAGVTVVPALLIGVDEEGGREIALIENLHRSELHPLELAQAFDAILRGSGITQDELARRLGKSRVSITNTLRLLGLGYRAQQALSAGQITEGHARALLGLTGGAQEDALGHVLSRELSVRQAEALVRKHAARRSHRQSSSERTDMRLLSDALQTVLGAPVSVLGTEDNGRILIDYNSREELERLCERIGGGALADELA